MWHNNSPSDLEIMQPGALPQAVHSTSLTYLVVGCTALGWAACCVLVKRCPCLCQGWWASQRACRRLAAFTTQCWSRCPPPARWRTGEGLIAMHGVQARWRNCSCTYKHNMAGLPPAPFCLEHA